MRTFGTSLESLHLFEFIAQINSMDWNELLDLKSRTYFQDPAKKKQLRLIRTVITRKCPGRVVWGD